MSRLEVSGLPTFFNYEEEGTDNGYETIQDFNLSWIIRCADDKFKKLNPKLHEYARHTVFALINGYNNGDTYKLDNEMGDEFRITKVKTRRQWKQIDLIAELDIDENSIQKRYVLNIENKWYTSIRSEQLENSIKNIKNEYGKDEIEIVNLVIFCDYEILKMKPNEKQKCNVNGFKFLAISDIQELTKMKIGKETGNALFDAYWF